MQLSREARTIRRSATFDPTMGDMEHMASSQLIRRAVEDAHVELSCSGSLWPKFAEFAAVQNRRINPDCKGVYIPKKRRPLPAVIPGNVNGRATVPNPQVDVNKVSIVGAFWISITLAPPRRTVNFNSFDVIPQYRARCHLLSLTNAPSVLHNHARGVAKWLSSPSAPDPP